MALVLPQVGADLNAWGDIVNAALQYLDGRADLLAGNDTTLNAAIAAAQATANAAIPASSINAASGVVGLDVDGNVDIVALDPDLDDRLTAVESSNHGVISWFDRFRTINSVSQNDFVAGNVSEEFRLAADATLVGPYLRGDDYSSTDHQYDVEVSEWNGTSWNGFSSIYTGATPPLFPATALNFQAPDPPAGLAFHVKNSLVRTRCLVPPSAGSGGGSAAVTAGASAIVNTAGDYTSKVWTVTAPTGFVAGEFVMAIFSIGQAVTAPSNGAGPAWTKVADWPDSGTPNSYPQVFVAPWSATISYAFTTAVGTFGIGWTMRLQNVDTNSFYQVAQMTPTTGSTATFPGVTAGQLTDLEIVVIAPYFGNVGSDGFLTALTGGPTGNTQDYNNDTTRTTAKSDRNLYVGLSTHSYAAAASVASGTLALSAGNGGGTGGTVWSGGLILVKRAPGAHGPATVTIQQDALVS